MTKYIKNTNKQKTAIHGHLWMAVNCRTLKSTDQ